MLEKIASFANSTAIIVLGIIMTFASLLPLYVIGTPFWADILILACIQFTMLIGKFLSIALWIWGLVIILANPITVFSVFYFVLFGICCLNWLLTFCGILFNK